MATFELEQKLYQGDYSQVIGIDEAGRGPLAGPVVASACALKSEKIHHLLDASRNSDMLCDEELWKYVRDSKKISEKKRQEVYEFIYENYDVGVGIVDNITIDQINILQATFEAMRLATEDLLDSSKSSEGAASPMPDEAKSSILLIDGNQYLPGTESPQKTITGGDGKVKCIAAASVIAKVTRDRIMEHYASTYPEYSFEKHKGYGTKVHMDALKEFGPTPIHRVSYAPVRKAMQK